MNWELHLPREWTDESDRCRRAGVPDDVVHQEKWRIALGLLGTLTDWQSKAPVVVAAAGYGVSTPFRTGDDEYRGAPHERVWQVKCGSMDDQRGPRGVIEASHVSTNSARARFPRAWQASTGRGPAQ